MCKAITLKEHGVFYFWRIKTDISFFYISFEAIVSEAINILPTTFSRLSDCLDAISPKIPKSMIKFPNIDSHLLLQSDVL